MKPNNEIWLLVDSRGTGGIETHILELASALQQQARPVVVVFLKDYGPHPLRDALSVRGISTHTLDGQLATLIRYIRIRSPKILHSHGYKAGLMCCLAALRTGTRHCTTYHAGEVGRGRMAFYDWLYRQASRLNDINLAVSARIASRVPAGCAVMDNFLSIPEPAAGERIAFVGRLSEEKGPDRLLDIARQMPDTTFHVYGDGPMAPTLTRQAGLNCRFHGNQDSMDPHWRDIGLLLIPSRYEGLPMAALEAMARGIPVIAFDVGALARIVIPGRTGWLIQADDLAAFQRAVSAWKDLSAEAREPVRRAAREHVARHFSAEHQLPRLLHYYAHGIESPVSSCDAICKSALQPGSSGLPAEAVKPELNQQPGTT